MVSTHLPAMDLNIDDLAITYKETFTARGSWYNMGLALEVPVATLDDIDNRSRDPKDLLREVLKAWLRRAHKPTWQSLVDALDNPIVDEPRLARTLQEKYCAALQPEPTSSMQLLREQVVADTEATAALKEAYLQQEHTLEDLQGTVAARSFQIQEFEEQVSEKKTKLEDTVTAQGLQIHEMVGKVREKKAQQQEEMTSSLRGNIHLPSEVNSDPNNDTVPDGGLRLRWTVEESAPDRMVRGQAVVDGSMVYFLSFPECIIHSYDSERKVWSTLPECPYWDCSLAVVNGLLTTIGGEMYSQSKSKPTNTLLSLIVKDKETDGEWCEQFHPMPTKRYGAAAVCTEKALVVAGGGVGLIYAAEVAGGGVRIINASDWRNTVEVMDTETLQWSTASSLPHPLNGASATVCGDDLYLMRGDTCQVLTCSLPNLLKSCWTRSLTARIKSAFTRREAVWQTVADVPVRYTTCVAFNGHLLTVGGVASNGRSTNNIYTLHPTTKSWEVTSHMPTARSQCLVAVLPDNRLMVVGGWDGTRLAGIDTVQIAEMI